VKERRKPDRRWQSREIGGGFPQTGASAKAALLSRRWTLVEERRSGPGKPLSLTRGRRKRPWFLEASRISGRLRGATGGVRGRSPTLQLGRKRRARGAPPKRRCSLLAGRKARENVVCVTTEAGGAPSSACPTGIGLPQGGPVPPGRTRSRSGKHPAVIRSASCEPGNRAVHGCSCRGSVAEVGKEAPSPCRRGEPRGEPSRGEVARFGGSRF